MSESTLKTRRAMRARERQKRKLMLLGGLAILLVLVIILAVFVFGSCGKYDTDTSAVYVQQNGKVVSVSVEEFDEDTYSKGKLKDYIKEVIASYNEESGEKLVKQKDFVVEDDVASLVMEYATTDAFEDFEGVELFTGTIAEAKEAGYKFDVDFASVADGKVKEAKADDFMEDEAYQVVIIKANTKVCVAGEIAYVSTENIADVMEDAVVIKDGVQLEMHEADTQQGEATEGSEISDGSVDEGALGQEESTEIVFDFGEEEPESQYSDVYTYIIYK